MKRDKYNKTILHIEDATVVYKKLKNFLENTEETKHINLVTANCVEIANYQIQSGNIDALIVDVQIEKCRNVELANSGLSSIDLPYSPYYGIALLLHIQGLNDRIVKMPKLIYTSHSLSAIQPLYDKLISPKNYLQKSDPDIDLDNEFYHDHRNILDWITENGI